MMDVKMTELRREDKTLERCRARTSESLTMTDSYMEKEKTEQRTANKPKA